MRAVQTKHKIQFPSSPNELQKLANEMKRKAMVTVRRPAMLERAKLVLNNLIK